MIVKHRRRLLVAAGACGLVCILPAARAQSAAWPATTRVVVPLPAGGGIDVVVRKLGESLARQLGTAVVVENKAGASGLLGAKAAAMAPADGSTILYLHSGIVTAQAVTGRLDILKEFKPVTKISSSPHLLVVRSDSPRKSAAELIAAIKAQPGKLTFGSGGPGSPTHLMFELLDDAVPGGLKATHIPFKGAVDAAVAMIAGDIDFQFTPPGSVVEHIRSGKLRALASTGVVRMPQFPHLPTLSEAGAPGYVAEPWGAFVVPARTPDDVVERLAAATRAAAAAPEFVEMVQRVGGKIELSASPSEFAAALRKDIEADARLVKRLGLKAE